MSDDQQINFDDWQKAAEEVEKQEQAKLQQKAIEQKNKQNQPQIQQQKIKQQAKQTLKDKLKNWKALSSEQKQAKFTEIQQQSRGIIKATVNTIMKSDKDFKNFAVQVSERLGRDISEDDTLDQQSLVTFIEELMLCLYDGLQWESFVQVKNKLKIIKNERKAEEKKAAKKKPQQQKSKTKAKQEQKIINVKPREDDLFGGAGMNSKQQEEQRKKKAAQKKIEQKQEEVVAETKVEQMIEKPAQDDDDDDDFM